MSRKNRQNEKSGNKRKMSQSTEVDDYKELYECVYQAKNERYGFAIQCSNGEPDIYIPHDLSYCAMNGDKILVVITNISRRVGKIIKIIERSTKNLVGIYSNGTVTSSFPNAIKISVTKKNSLQAKDGEAVLVEIKKYPTNFNPAQGKVLEIIKSCDNQDIYIKSLYVKHDLYVKGDFSVLDEELKDIRKEILAEDFVGRIDKTNEEIFTIDPDDAMDLDDAISLKKLGENYLLSVHIADVSHYVKDGTLIDEKANTRGTSIYIPGTCIPMLPRELSNDVCSLNEGVLRLALSIDITIDKTGNVIDNKIYKSVIKVTKKMSYAKVYKAIEATDIDIEHEYHEFIPKLIEMQQLAKVLRDKRLSKGSIDFNIPETKVVLDELGNVKSIGAYQKSYTNNMIEEFMLIANMTIAQTFYWLKAPFIYRVHESPSSQKMEDLSELLLSYGIFENLKGEVTSKKLADILANIKDETTKTIISEKILRSLMQARYSPERIDHFGLAEKYYCHFTSPIRRYPDLFIHRVISEYIDYDNVLPENIKNLFKDQAKQYALNSSTSEREAVNIEREFEKLYMCLYMKNKIGEEFVAVIVSITKIGMFVKLDNTVEGLILESSLEDDRYIFDETKCMLVGHEKGKTFEIGTKHKVILTECNINLRQITFRLS